ncbi:MAG TPA: hypothetical protein VFV34_14310 [Blastocatellia bacterium]|nr:hypothetical protein [Blastocatellia bacterium]
MILARTFLITILIAELMGCAGCGRQPGDGVSGSADRKDQARETDDLAREELNDPNHAEAREWLRDPSHILFEGSREHVVTLVDQFYRDGAVKVWVTGIERIMDADVTATIVVELPDGKASRKKIFDVEASWQKDAGEDPAVDVGQKYLRILLD